MKRVVLPLLLLAVLSLGAGCAAQSTDVNQKIERRVRATYNVPDEDSVVVGPRTASDFPNYDSVVVTVNDHGHVIPLNYLLSKDGNTLVRITKYDLSRDPYAEIMKKIDITGRPMRGNKDAKVTIVTFDDFQCPYCAIMHQTFFGQVFKDYVDKVRVIYKDFPLAGMHPWATRAAYDANCLAAQNNDAYWDFADTVHGNYDELNVKGKTLLNHFDDLQKITLEEGVKHGLDMTKLNACLKTPDEQVVKKSVAEGEALGVDATPTLYINGRKMDGAHSPEEIREALNMALKEVGETPPAPPKPAAAAAPESAPRPGSAQK